MLPDQDAAIEIALRCARDELWECGTPSFLAVGIGTEGERHPSSLAVATLEAAEGLLLGVRSEHAPRYLFLVGKREAPRAFRFTVWDGETMSTLHDRYEVIEQPVGDPLL